MSLHNPFHKHRPIANIVVDENWFHSTCSICGKAIYKSKIRKDNWDLTPDSLKGPDDGIDSILGGIVIGLAIVVWAWVISK